MLRRPYFYFIAMDALSPFQIDRRVRSLTSIFNHVSPNSNAQELDVCDQDISEGGDATVYKQVGPVLIKNDLDEAKETIEKRLEFISAEM